MNFEFLQRNRIVPVIKLERVEDALPTLEALRAGGIRVAEITFRTACAVECIKVASKMDGMLVGAGTVINKEQCELALEAGAKFVVSPGLSEEAFEVCNKRNIPYLAGVVTPSEIIKAKSLGLDTLKFFPAEAYGGIKTIKALSAAFPDVSFVPTGGVDESNFVDYLKLKQVAAIGGSWLLKGDIKRNAQIAVERLNNL